MFKLAAPLAAVALLALASPRASAVMAKVAAKPAAKARPAATATATPSANAKAKAIAPGKLATKTVSKTASKKNAPKNGPVVLYHVNRRETMALRLRDGHGRPVKGMQKRFDHFLRCHYTNAQHKMDPRLLRLIYTTGHHYPGRRIEVVSGYRHPSVAKNPHSPHMQGLACDFRVEGIKTAELRDYLRKTYDKVGVGYYPNSSFVHLDVRKDRSAFWIDYSGPGERSMYSETPDQDLRSGRADRYHPTKIDNDWTESGTADGTAKGAGAGTGDGAGAAPPPDDKDQGTP